MSRAARVAGGLVSAIALLALLVGVPVLLASAVGWPLPRVLPAWGDMTATLSGDLPLDPDTVWKVLACVVWLAWAQLLGASVIEGAAVARGRVATPIRGLAHMQGLAGPLLSAAAMLFPSSLDIASGGGAPPPLSAARNLAALAEPAPVISGESGPGSNGPTSVVVEAPTFEHVVVRRDTLWDLAERYLAPGGTTEEIGAAVQRLFDLNSGLPQPDGSTLSDASVIRPGWVLRIPGESEEQPVPASASVIVEPGDSLWEIAEEELHDGYRYREIFDLNAGRPQPDGEALTDPSHIEPGWQLDVPQAVLAPQMTPPSPEAEPAPPPAIPPTAPPAPPPPAVPGDAAPIEQPATTTTTSEALTPSTTFDAPSAADPSSAADESADEDMSSAAGVLGIAGAFLATGLVTLVARRRRRQLATRRPGTEPPPLPESAEAVVAALAQVDVDYTVGVDRALRHLGRSLQERQSVPVPVVATLHEASIDLLLDRIDPDPPRPWVADGGGRIWRSQIEACSDELDAGPAWLPTLVSIGALDRGGLLVNLEAVGVAAIVGEAAAVALARSIVVELAMTPLADVAAVHVVGSVVGPVTELPGVRRHADIGAALAAAVEDAAPVSGALAGTGAPNAVELRCRAADEAWAPAVLVASASDLDADGLTRVVECCHERAGVVAVLVGGSVAGALEIVVSDGAASIPALGLSCAPQQLHDEASEAIAEVLDVADNPCVEPPDDDPLTLFSPTELDNTRDDDGSTKLHVHLLGPMRVDGAELSPQQLAVVAYLVLHPDATSDALRDAVWGGKTPKRERFLNTMHELRRVVGADVLPSSTDGRYRIRRSWSDLAEVERLVAAASVDPDQRASELRAVLELVSGPPLTFESRHRRHFTWIDLGNHSSRWERIIGDAAHDLARIALDQGDLDLARWAAERGLLASPASQTLTCDLVSALLAAGDRNAAEHVVDAYGRVLEDLGYDETPDELHELLESRRAS